jgi:hypothetical protein
VAVAVIIGVRIGMIAGLMMLFPQNSLSMVAIGRKKRFLIRGKSTKSYAS